MGQMGVGGGPSAKRRHRGCAGTGSPAPLVPVSCRYLLVNRCSFFPHRRGKFWPDLEKQSNPHACDRLGVAGGRDPAILVFSGEATLLHSSGVIPCACSKLWWNYLASQHEEMETNF